MTQDSEPGPAPETPGSAGPAGHGTCLNCDASLRGQYCWQCGQRATGRLITLRELVADLIDALIDADSRLWRSLILLVFRPGRLTVDYLSGRRARYIPPFRMYIVITGPGAVTLDAEQEAEIREEIDALREDIGDERADAVQKFVDQLDADAIADTAPSCSIGDFILAIPGTDAQITGEELEQICQNAIDAGPAAFAEALIENLPAAIFIFLPFIALILKILYLGSGRFFVEHLLFLLHYHSFFFVLFTVVLTLESALSLLAFAELVATPIGFVSIVYVPVYLFKALRRVYGQGAAVTAFKYVILCSTYFVSMLIAFIGLVIFTALTI